MSLTFIPALVLWIAVAALFFRGHRSKGLWLAALWLLGAAAAWAFGLSISWLLLQVVLAIAALLLLTASES